MQFSQIINAAISQENDRPLMQKEVYPVGHALQQYLLQYRRDTILPIQYKSLFHYRYTDAIKDHNGKHTHWENVIYTKEFFSALEPKLLATYRLLKPDAKDNYRIVAIHFCEFANSMPFRIIVANLQSMQEDYYYIKDADASRIYGLELEHLLSPNQVNFFYHQQTLVEEHITGLPGDVFLANLSTLTASEKKNLAEEFVRFNERCFGRLLGDMRSYNFVVIAENAIPDTSFRIRAIDFDQQCYEGRLQLYLPQFYKENHQYVQLTLHTLESAAIESIRRNERLHLATFAAQHRIRLTVLFAAMIKEELAENYKIATLRKELDRYYGTCAFAHCTTMGAIVQQQLTTITSLHGGDVA